MLLERQPNVTEMIHQYALVREALMIAEIERLDRAAKCKTPNAKVNGAGTASAGLPGYAGDNNGE